MSVPAIGSVRCEPELTREAYALMDCGAAEVCGCETCFNFATTRHLTYTPEVLELLLRSGLNDWGGVSPVTLDFINPEAPWPTLRALRERTEASGQKLCERGPVYPDWIIDQTGSDKTGSDQTDFDQTGFDKTDFFDPQMRAMLTRYATDEGYARRPNHQSGEEAA